MNGYCEIGKIYYAIADKTAFAKYPDGFSEACLSLVNNYESLIETGSYQGEPPFKRIQAKLSKVHREYHSAEHKVYNCFNSKIKNLSKDAEIKELRRKIPSLEEVKAHSDFSPFCGTTIFLFSGIILLISALPNIFNFHNHNLFFMLIWLTASVLIARTITELIQRKFFLADAKDHQIVLAIKALKEVLNYE